MFRNRFIIGATTVAGLSAAGLLLAGPALGGSASTSKTLHLNIQQVSFTTLSKHQFSEADAIRSHGKRIGNDVLFGRIVSPGTARAHVTAALRGGELRLSFTQQFSSGQFAGKVAGGTGAYAGATGTITGTANKQGAVVTVKYTTP